MHFPLFTTGEGRGMLKNMPERYPPIDPYETGLLEVGDGNLIYWESCGNPDGKPAVVLHGGPGSGCTEGARRNFDPAAYRIVLFDQRNCGRSMPHASDPTTDLSTNTTQHLIADLELLRKHLGIEQWLVFGASWGATLALAYAEEHPSRVSGIVLFAVTNTTRAELEWLYHGAARFFPEAWDTFKRGVPDPQRHGDLIAAYHRLMESPDPAVREQAAYDWCTWEDSLASHEEGWGPTPRYADLRFRLCFARIVTHYFANHGFLTEGQLLANVDRLHGIPAVLIHGRLDMGSPPDTAWRMAQAWPDAELQIIPGGHGSGPYFAPAIIAATDRFRR
jgi:proline iminopeptidase